MKQSSGILVYRKGKMIEVFLVHPGGPFWAKKDMGAWSIPKGEFAGNEEALPAAIREFKEETGFDIDGRFESLTPVRQKGGKMVYAWCVEGNIDETKLTSNMVSIQWPPRSGKTIAIPEVDKGCWFNVDLARQKINPAQAPFINELLIMLSRN